MYKAILFDWGNTLMVDFPDEKGPMYSWKKVVATQNALMAVKKLSLTIKCYIATNAKDSSKEDIYKALRIVGLEKYIEDIFCYKEIGFEKPTIEYFEVVINRLGIGREEIMFIGDDFEKDYLGARKNGINSILYDPNNKQMDIKDRIIDLLEIMNVLRQTKVN